MLFSTVVGHERVFQSSILILGKSQEGSKDRALHLLSLLKEAGRLTKQKNVEHTNEVVLNSQSI
jgi:hypothetical protein